MNVLEVRVPFARDTPRMPARPDDYFEPSIDMFSAVDDMPKNLQRLVALVTDNETEESEPTAELWVRNLPPG